MDVEGPGDVTDRFAFVDQAADEILLVGSKLSRPAEGDAALFGGGSPVLGALADELTFEFGNSGKDGQHHPSGGRGRVRPRLLKRLKSRTFLLDDVGKAQQLRGRARK